MIAKGYKLPHEFPHESFIQEVLEDFFESEGYSIIEEKPIDIKCLNADKNETWIIEVKGKNITDWARFQDMFRSDCNANE